MKYNEHLRTLILGCFILIVSNVCGLTAFAQKSETLLFDGLSMIGRSPEEVEKILGKPLETEKNQITEDALKLPGRHIYNEIRHYKIDGKDFVQYTHYGVRVRFLLGKVISFDVDLPKPAKTPEEAMFLVGIDVKDKKDYPLSSETAKFWRDEFSGKILTVAATKYNRERNLFDLVEVRLLQTELPDLSELSKNQKE